MLALFAILLGQLVFSAPAMAQHTSLACPVQTASVQRGGSVEIDITDCDDYNFGYGFGVPLTRNGPNSGDVLVRQAFVPPSTAQSFLRYTHNGDSATSDVFEFEDLDNRWVQVRVTITAPPVSRNNHADCDAHDQSGRELFSNALVNWRNGPLHLQHFRRRTANRLVP
ncbi:hypothetical protein G6N82_10655 [Altererythrobacter sp. BO-6]|nr:hypothetical protein G6N82_10655 [Altererythrobacter sp. BO-6]